MHFISSLARLFKIPAFLFSMVLLMLAGAMIFDFSVRPDEVFSAHVAEIQSRLIKKEKTVSKNLSQVMAGLLHLNDPKDVFNMLLTNKTLADETVTYCIYFNDSLVYWSDNKIDIPDILHQEFEVDVVRWDGTWIRILKLHRPPFTVIGLIHVKYTFNNQNQYVKPGFAELPAVPSFYTVQPDTSVNKVVKPVFSINGKKVFFIAASNFDNDEKRGQPVVFIFYMLAFVFFLTGLHFFNDKDRSKYRFSLLISVILLAIVRFMMIQYKIPLVFYESELFNPQVFASSAINPSLGDLLINSFSIFLLIYWLYRKIQLPVTVKLSSFWQNVILVFSGILIYAAVYAVHYMSVSLVVNSNITFETYKILDLSYHTLVSYAILFILLISLFLVCDFFICWQKATLPFNEYVKISAVTGFVIVIAGLLSGKYHFLFSVSWYWLLSYIIGYIRYKSRFGFASVMILVLAAAVYSVILVHISTISRERSNMKTKAISLAYEHDPVAELQLVDIDKKMTSDTTLERLVCSENLRYEVLFYYLRDNYFSGYFNRYDLQITYCSDKDSVYISEPENRREYCFGFFQNLVERYGQQLPDSRFFYLNHQEGLISYYREMPFKLAGGAIRRLYIELDSRLVNELLGYPELLLDERTSRLVNAVRYPYAKYKNNRLIARSGDFQYSYIWNLNSGSTSEFSVVTSQGYEHVIYQIDNQTTIVLSNRRATWFNLLISLTYVFIFYLSAVIVVLFLFFRNTGILTFELGIKNKIQFAIIFMLLITMILMGSANMIFALKQNRNQQEQLIREKLQSVQVELQNKLGYESNLNTIPVEYLSNLLIKFSNVFYTDINLFDVDGKLMATSRNEIYEDNLSGTRLNPVVFKNLVIDRQAVFIHTEKIGTLTFYSSYMPFFSQSGKILAYINLPYFSHQNDLSNQLSVYFAAMINIYVFLVLMAIFVALAVADKLALPLKIIQQKMKQIDILKKSEPITYSSRDEIGSLIKVYNQMVEELAASAEKLARSERESAWREMAKQVAHEIRNPLTPMKLKVQLIEKMWKSNDPAFGIHFEQTSKTLIEQIDALSVIAGEFSDFARIPRALPGPVNVVERIYSSVALFEGTPNLESIMVDCPYDKIWIFADNEQLIQVFNNLIKNAVQAAGDEKPARVMVKVVSDGQSVKVDIIDNGTGIPDEMAGNLFKPNFTTKTSGMGLGLSIVKTIVDQFGGKINYRTSASGSVFTVSFPILSNHQH